MELLRKFWSDDDGQDLVEYALIAGLVSIIAVIAITNAGTKVSEIWSKIESALGTV